MAQDTRKDPRAKVLTMTVRYKSATVDEFIEHHSHDVSRGGIYIKTPAPFQPGTLLKFEIRIADDKPMLQGVGRVVWKRESAGPGSEKPAGMGVKFIKVDEASRNLIDRLIVSKGDSVSSYDAEPAEPSASGSLRSTQAGIRPGSSDAQGPRSPQGGVAMRRGTMIGLGIDPTGSEGTVAARGLQRPSQAPRPGDAMFPKTQSEAEMPPPEERTVMKQAAQLLEEALKGAGGSIEELGGSHAESAAKQAAKAASPEPARSSGSMAASTPARAAGSAAASGSSSASGATSTASSTSRRGGEAAEPRQAAKPRLPPEMARPVSAAPITDKDKKEASGRTIAVSLLFVAAVSVLAYLAWRKDAPEPTAEPAAATVAPAPVLPVPAAPVAEPLVVPPAAPVASVAMGTGSAAAPAPAAPNPAATASAVLVLPPRPGPAASLSASPPPVAAPAPKPAAPLDTGPAALHETSKPAPSPPASREVVKAAPAPAKPKPVAPKPAPKDDDNPY